jgi:hypothetical protein
MEPPKIPGRFKYHQGSWLKHATTQKPNIDLQSIDQSQLSQSSNGVIAMN